ncbi:MAG TPA: C39 family peptidase [Chloroflexia bacterium]|nr:C39 family peptidase [Chloroflexia bacterium]
MTQLLAQPGRKRKSLLKRYLLGGSLLAALSFLGVPLFTGAFMAATPTAAASMIWDRVMGLFSDNGWKEKVQQVATFQIPPTTERENLLLYKPLYVNGQKVADDDSAHWLNYGKADATIYRPPVGKSTYTFDIGREALVDELFMVMACKECGYQVITSQENPPDPANSSHRLTPDEVGAYYTPERNFPQLDNVQAWAIINDNKPHTSARYVTLLIDNRSPDAYFVQLMAYPPGQRSNALWSGQPQLDSRYRSIYEGAIATAGGHPGAAVLAPTNIRQDNQEYSYYAPLADGSDSPALPLYPVVGANPAQAGQGTAADTQAGYRKIYLGWQLHPYTKGKADEIGLHWQNPSARSYQLYFLNSQDAGDKAVINALFGNNSATQNLLAGGEANLPANRLLKDFSGPAASSSSTGPLGIGADDPRDFLLLVFEQSNFQATAGATPTPTPDPANGQPNALPAAWLNPAEIYLYEKLPPTPLKWPKAIVAVSAGAFDIRYGTITLDKIEQVIASQPWRGIASGGYQAGEPPTPNKLTGKGQVFIDLGKKYGINPAYALAFALKETQLGTTGYHVYNADTGQWGYNLYGMTNHGADGIWAGVDRCIQNMNGRFCGYASWEDSIEEFFVLLKAYSDGQILTHDGVAPGQKACPCNTVDRILYWYAPVTENDTSLYINQVEGWITDWGATSPYGGLGSGPGGGSGPVPAINQYDCSQYNGTYPCNVWADSTCGPTSATMLIDWISGQNLRVADTLTYAAGNGVSPSGTYGWAYLDSMKSIYGFTWRTVAFNSTADYLAGLKQLTGQGQPVIANVVGAPYYYGHFLVVVGYNPEDNTFTINDPADVRQAGNPPGVIQKWPAPLLESYVAGRLGSGYPAIIISKAGSNSPVPAFVPELRAGPGLLSSRNGMGQVKGPGAGSEATALGWVRRTIFGGGF